MIIVNGVKFAANDREFVESLFDPTGTATGYYRKLKRAIQLFDKDKQLIAVINKWLVVCNASKLPDGRVWYGFLPSSHLLYADSLLEQRNQLVRLTTSFTHEPDGSIAYCFK
jgi:hypothetical protein